MGTGRCIGAIGLPRSLSLCQVTGSQAAVSLSPEAFLWATPAPWLIQVRFEFFKSVWPLSRRCWLAPPALRNCSFVDSSGCRRQDWDVRLRTETGSAMRNRMLLGPRARKINPGGGSSRRGLPASLFLGETEGMIHLEGREEDLPEQPIKPLLMVPKNRCSRSKPISRLSEAEITGVWAVQDKLAKLKRSQSCFALKQVKSTGVQVLLSLLFDGWLLTRKRPDIRETAWRREDTK